MHERPRRQEEDRLLTLAVGLPEDAHAFALDEALLVRVAGAALLAALLARGQLGDGHGVLLSSSDSSQRSIQSSSSPCPSSIPSSRSSAKPWPKVMVIATSASTGNSSPSP